MSTAPAPSRSDRINASPVELAAFGQRLALARETFHVRTRAAAPISQAVLAESAGITRASIAAYETGRNVPTVGLVQHLATLLEVRPEFLTVAAYTPPGALGAPAMPAPAAEEAAQ